MELMPLLSGRSSYRLLFEGMGSESVRMLKLVRGRAITSKMYLVLVID
jgi:hypothetical protein